MEKKTIVVMSSWVLLLILISTFALLNRAYAEEKRVLVVHSYHFGTHVPELEAGIKQALEGSGATIEIMYMDTKRKPGLEWKKKAGELAKKKVEQWKPDVVITSDDNAQEFFARDYAGKKGTPQFVFCGVNAEPEEYGYPAENVTGVIERQVYDQNVQLLIKIVPEIKEIAVITDDSLTSDIVIAYMKTLQYPVEITYYQVVTFDEWKTRIKEFQSFVDAIFLLLPRTIKQHKGSEESIPFEEVMKWTMENNRLPTVSSNWERVQAGVLCGIQLSMEEQGFAAGLIAKEILDGKTAKDFEILPTRKGNILLNLRTAEALGIEIPYNMIKRAHKVVK